MHVLNLTNINVDDITARYSLVNYYIVS